MYPEFNANAVNRTGVLIAGSAGGGVQSAARMLAGAGILSGLYTTMKSDYPITVGTGYSVAEVILSRDKIHYSGLESPDVIIIVTEDGMLKVKDGSEMILHLSWTANSGMKAISMPLMPTLLKPQAKKEPPFVLYPIGWSSLVRLK